MPENWREVKWLYQAWHTDHFAPDYAYNQSDMLSAGNGFDGSVAMGTTAICGTPAARPTFPNWDIAVVPYNGTYTSKLHADTQGASTPSTRRKHCGAGLPGGWPGHADLLQVYGHSI